MRWASRCELSRGDRCGEELTALRWLASRGDRRNRMATRALRRPAGPHGRAARWGGSGRFLSYELCQAMRRVLIGDEIDPSWSKRAQQTLRRMRRSTSSCRIALPDDRSPGGDHLVDVCGGGANCFSQAARGELVRRRLRGTRVFGSRETRRRAWWRCGKRLKGARAAGRPNGLMHGACAKERRGIRFRSFSRACRRGSR